VEKKDEFLSSEVAEESSATSNKKKPYTKPVFTEYGSISKLTRASTGSVGDGGGGGMMRACL
jgi:hypothetical protein